MKTLIEMQQEFAAKVNQSREFLDKGEMDAYNKIDADIDALGVQIEALKKQEDRESILASSAGRKTKVDPIDGAEPTGRASAEYKTAFLDAVRNGGLLGISAESRAVVRNVMQTKTDPAGGFLVMPAEMETAIRELAQNTVVMRSLATVVKSSADKKVPFVASYGAASWLGENGAYSKVDDSFGVVSIGSNKLGKIIVVSEELINDADFDLTGHINRSFAVAFGNAEEDAFINGDGSNKPLGVLQSAINGVTAAATTAITSDELLDLFYALHEKYVPNATFLMKRTTEKILRKLKNATTGDYMWQPGLTAGQPSTLLGRPVAYSAYMPAATAGLNAIAFGDFKQYTIKDTTGMEMSVLRELYAENGQVGFKGNERTDGALIIKEAVKTLTMKA